MYETQPTVISFARDLRDDLHANGFAAIDRTTFEKANQQGLRVVVDLEPREPTETTRVTLKAPDRKAPIAIASPGTHAEVATLVKWMDALLKDYLYVRPGSYPTDARHPVLMNVHHTEMVIFCVSDEAGYGFYPQGLNTQSTEIDLMCVLVGTRRFYLIEDAMAVIEEARKQTVSMEMHLPKSASHNILEEVRAR